MSWIIVTQSELSFGISSRLLEAVIPVNYAGQRTECDLCIHTWVPTPALPLDDYVTAGGLFHLMGPQSPHL